MEATLNYPFKRQSENYLDWLINIIKSEKYFEADGFVLPTIQSNKIAR